MLLFGKCDILYFGVFTWGRISLGIRVCSVWAPKFVFLGGFVVISGTTRTGAFRVLLTVKIDASLLGG